MGRKLACVDRVQTLMGYKIKKMFQVHHWVQLHHFTKVKTEYLKG